MMNNILEYKGYHTRIEFDSEDMILYGKIEGIKDLVTFESESIETISDEFHSAVDDYLDYCNRIGKIPDKEFKGSFNIRVTPQIHKDAFIKALKNGQSLNSYVTRALEKDLYENRELTTNIIFVRPEELKNYSNGSSILANSVISQGVYQTWN